MNTIFKKAGIVAAISATILLPSCSDDDATPKDQTLPEITLASSATSTTVWNTVKLTATATDDQGIDKIEIKVDGTSVGTAATSPYEFSWDTQAGSDGQHTVTAIATDKAGNLKTAELTVTVQNVLLETKIDSDLLPMIEGYQARGFIFLSDNDGKVIVAQEYHNGDAVSLKAPAFEGNEFSVTEGVKSSEDYIYLITTTHVSRGKWVLNQEDYYEGEPNPIVGDANVSFKGLIADGSYDLITANGGMSGMSSTDPVTTIELRLNPSRLYVVSHDVSGEEKYNVFPSIAVGTNPLFDLALVNKSMTKETITLPQDIKGFNLNISGVFQTGDNIETYRILNGGGGGGITSIDVDFPGDGFPVYHSETEWYNDDYNYYNRLKKRYDFTPLAATLDASYSQNKFTVAATGSMDLYHIDIDRRYQYWQVVAPKSATTIALPEIPAIIKDYVDTDMSSAYFTIVAEDYTQVEGFDGLLNFIRNSKKGYFELSEAETAELKSVSRDFENTGGRKAGKKKSNRHLPGHSKP